MTIAIAQSREDLDKILGLELLFASLIGGLMIIGAVLVVNWLTTRAYRQVSGLSEAMGGIDMATLSNRVPESALPLGLALTYIAGLCWLTESKYVLALVAFAKLCVLTMEPIVHGDVSSVPSIRDDRQVIGFGGMFPFGGNHTDPGKLSERCDCFVERAFACNFDDLIQK